jgi:mannose-6-phosphate isomerase-like protein (cupin superfamily)
MAQSPTNVPVSQAVQVAAGNDRFDAEVRFANGRFDCKVSAKDTNGNLCIYDTLRTEKGGPPLHLHHAQDEWFFVREGEFIFQVGADTFRLKAGDSLCARYSSCITDGVGSLIKLPSWKNFSMVPAG